MSDHVLARLGDTASPAVPVAPALRERGGKPHSDDARPMVPLTSLGRHATGVVAGVRVAQPCATGTPDPALERMALRLIEIGFVQGERLRVVAFGQPGADPIGVRIGGRGGSSTFALRRQEAGCVWVWPDRA